jgi:hypothetical protein
MDALNETLKDSGIHFETIQEAKQWLEDHSDVYITTLQNEAMATALFSLQTETLKENLLKLKAGFEDLTEVTWQEKGGNLWTFIKGGKYNKDIKAFSGILNELYEGIKKNEIGLQKTTEIAKALTWQLSEYGKGDEQAFFESIGFYIQGAVESGEDLDEVVEKLKNAEYKIYLHLHKWVVSKKLLMKIKNLLVN